MGSTTGRRSAVDQARGDGKGLHDRPRGAPARPVPPHEERGDDFDGDDPRVETLESVLLAVVALPLLSLYAVVAVRFLTWLATQELGPAALLASAACQGVLGASLYGLIAHRCRRLAESRGTGR